MSTCHPRIKQPILKILHGCAYEEYKSSHPLCGLGDEKQRYTHIPRIKEENLMCTPDLALEKIVSEGRVLSLPHSRASFYRVGLQESIHGVLEGCPSV